MQILMPARKLLFEPQQRAKLGSSRLPPMPGSPGHHPATALSHRSSTAVTLPYKLTGLPMLRVVRPGLTSKKLQEHGWEAEWEDYEGTHHKQGTGISFVLLHPVETMQKAAKKKSI